MRQDIGELLFKIKLCVEDSHRCKWGSSKKHIFQGSYDVWETKDDCQKFDDIMNYRLNEAKDLGLIINDSGEKDWKYNENWKLTDLGEIFYRFTARKPLLS